MRTVSKESFALDWKRFASASPGREKMRDNREGGRIKVLLRHFSVISPSGSAFFQLAT